MIAGVLTAAALSAAALVPVDSGGLEVTRVARSLQPGEVVSLRVRSRKALTQLTASAFGNAAACYQSGGPSTWRCLLGIDLETSPGRYQVELEGTDGNGGELEAKHEIDVAHKEFPTRHLTVDEKFVNPPEEVAARIERERERLDAIFAAASADKLWTGPFVAPVSGAATSSFGRRSVYNGQPRSPHSGADFQARAGTPVRAPNSGSIVLAENLYFAGNTVVIDHGLGLYSYLAHLSRFSVTEGTKLKRGDVIGRVGATGRVTGPHLHWSVRLAGARVDPLSLVAAVRDETIRGGPSKRSGAASKDPSRSR